MDLLRGAQDTNGACNSAAVCSLLDPRVGVSILAPFRSLQKRHLVAFSSPAADHMHSSINLALFQQLQSCLLHTTETAVKVGMGRDREKKGASCLSL